jgi:hypothetical protein
MSTNKPSRPLNESPEDGWVERQTIRNQMTMAMRKLEETLPRSERWPIREVVLEIVQAMCLKMLQHSKSTADIIANAQPPRRTADITPDQRDAHAARMAAMKARN